MNYKTTKEDRIYYFVQHQGQGFTDLWTQALQTSWTQIKMAFIPLGCDHCNLCHNLIICLHSAVEESKVFQAVWFFRWRSWTNTQYSATYAGVISMGNSTIVRNRKSVDLSWASAGVCEAWTWTFTRDGIPGRQNVFRVLIASKLEILI